MTLQRNSFISLMEDISILNKNIVEIVAKLNTVISSTDSSVQFTLYKPDGNQSTYNMPTVGYLETQINNINNNIKRLSTFNDSTSLIIDGKSVKRIYTTDLNNEPSPLNTIPNISTFEPINNHFFESLMNPLLSINIDLTDKVNDTVDGVLIRRYIVKFERNSDNTLTDNGLISYNDYINKFSNRSDISITEFTDWYYNPTNYGITIDTVEPYDEQQYNLSLKRLNSHGVFSVIRTEIDTLNKKYWYHLNTIKYYNIDGSKGTLNIGDELILNKIGSSTRWKIKEINTQNSLNMVTLERVDGYDSVPIGTDMLKIYSDTSKDKSVKINVGFGEYNILFIKPINKETNIVSNVWSKGISFYTNDLMLSTNQNMRLSEYYINSVYDYGKVLEDLVLKKIPTKYGQKPNSVLLNSDNFKVVQINDHLTNTSDSDVLKTLQSQKIKSKTKLSEYDNAIIIKNQDMNSFLTNAERIKLQNELQSLYTQQESETKNLSSIVNKINSITNTNIVEAKFRLRGFWSIPDPIITDNSQPQHVIQFKIQYRYSSKDGKTPSIKSFNFNQTNNILPSSSDISNVSETNTSTTSEYVNTNTAYFSNWVEFNTDVRKRYWDEVKGNWYWKIEDVSNADTPNINQIDIPIQKNERIEIRVKAISEVGWPDSLIESDWSNTLLISFPDDLNNIMNENVFILQEASSDSLLVNVTNELNSKGVYTHIKDSFYNGTMYYPHTDRNIAVTFKDDNGNMLTLFEYLTYLTNKILQLENMVKSAKGELRVMLYWRDTNGSVKNIEIKNNDVKTINIQCEDYATKIEDGSFRKYLNSLYNINNYYILIENKSINNPLGLLSNRLYDSVDTSNTFYKYSTNKAIVLDQNGDMYTQSNNQYIWFSDNSSNDMIYSSSTESAETQFNVLLSNRYNFGFSGTTQIDNPYKNIVELANNWTSTNSSFTGFCSTIHPMINQMSDIIETGQAKTKYVEYDDPIRIDINMFFKFDISGTTNYQINSNTQNSIHTKKLKCFIDTYSLSKPFEFELKFKLNKFRTYILSGYNTNIISGNDDVITI